MKNLNCAVIGCGVIAPSHIESFQKMDNVTISWFCDLDISKAESLADKYGVPNVSDDYHQVMKDSDVDCIAICTDHASHSPIAVAALNAGKHVLCEKALSSTTAGLDAMIEAHRQNSELVFAGVFQNRYIPIYGALKKLIADNAFGDLLTVNMHMYCLRTDEYYHSDCWRGTWAEEGGSLMVNQAIHFVDILNWVTGGISSISANFANITHGNSIETEDTVAVSIGFKNGALGTISASSSSNVLGWDPTFFINGTDASLDIRCGEITRLVCDNAKREQEIRNALVSESLTSETSAKSYYGPSHMMVIDDFIDAIRNEHDPFVTAESARDAVDISLAIYQSHHEGRRIALC
jgi:UDP-N-acetyl-2-amino-2-deoxyglucuronate dehydrogenase